MNISIRQEEEKDFKDVEYLTREAFWDIYKPGCDEHLVLHKIRKVSAFVKELDLIACDKDTIVGNIIYSRARVVNEENKEFEVLCMGPIAVLPSYQNQGIGSLLMEHSIEKARQLGYKGIVIFGNPDYYHRFGFVDAKEYNIQTSWGDNLDAFMALELYENSLKGISGKFFEDEAFKIDNAEQENFEKQFPYKEKHVTDTQLKQI
ncbi:MAG: Acetyltransferase (GNAT) family protein [Methanomethylovorans sp. PtaU1.Bin093]|jgi:predicted N-acetyltransferase YhbS|uniref:GNAT family N-acetyltransferase n=1 Tax=Methanomethylovorans sp. PtaU1.Bin093 TaxID=1811679 RepID=UPI0009C81906|nr:N-acetyltransferase [Methanomethylovorans sp. PtaU1.Bin093]OPY18007.1 MAG: Acetyltransferase (GNAT) family protein [Methanomethylovorans sp. PtaU1.Bin093]